MIPFAKTAVVFSQPGGLLVGEPAAFLGEALASGPVRRELELLMNAKRVGPELREGVEIQCSVLAAVAALWRQAEGATSAEGSAAGPDAERQAPSKGVLSPSRFSAQEASRMLGVTVRQVRYLAASGRLPGVRDRLGHWRLDSAGVEAELERRGEAA